MSGLIPDDIPADAPLAQYANLFSGGQDPQAQLAQALMEGAQRGPAQGGPPPTQPPPTASPGRGALTGAPPPAAPPQQGLNGPAAAQANEKDLQALYAQRSELLHQQMADRFGQYQEGASNYKDLLTQTIQSLNQLPVEPTQAEKLGRMAQAIGTPTRSGSFGEHMGNLGGASADLSREAREAQINKALLIAKYTGEQGQLGMQIPMAGLQQLTSQMNSNDTRMGVLAAALGRQNSPSAPVIINSAGQAVPNSALISAEGAKAAAQQKGKQDVMAGQWSPEALDLLSEQAYRTGKVTIPYGATRSNPGLVAQIWDQAAQKAHLDGNTPAETLANQNAYHAAALSMNDMTKFQSRVVSFEQTAEKNMDLAIQLGRTVDRSGSPLVNKGLIAWRQGVTGDKETQGFVNAVRAAQTEYAKVLSGATGASGITNAADKEATELFSKITNQETLEWVLGTVARQEMKNRTSSIGDNLGHLQDIMTRGSGAAPRPATPGTLPANTPGLAGPKPTATSADGKTKVQWNGTQWVPMGPAQ